MSNPTRSSSRQGSSTSCIHLHILSSVSCHPGPAPQVDHPAPGCCHIPVLSNILLPHEAVVTTISVRDFPWDASQREFVRCFSFSHGASEYSDNRVIGFARFSRLSTTPSRMHPVVHRVLPWQGLHRRARRSVIRSRMSSTLQKLAGGVVHRAGCRPTDIADDYEQLNIVDDMTGLVSGAGGI